MNNCLFDDKESEIQQEESRKIDGTQEFHRKNFSQENIEENQDSSEPLPKLSFEGLSQEELQWLLDSVNQFTAEQDWLQEQQEGIDLSRTSYEEFSFQPSNSAKELESPCNFPIQAKAMKEIIEPRELNYKTETEDTETSSVENKIDKSDNCKKAQPDAEYS